MKNCRYPLLLIMFIIGLFVSCKTTKPIIQRGMYFWKSNSYSLSEEENLFLKDQRIEKLYVKFFEVVPDEVFGAIPVAKSELHIWGDNMNIYEPITDIPATDSAMIIDSLAHANSSVIVNEPKNAIVTDTPVQSEKKDRSIVLEVVPVIYIKNEVFKDLSEHRLDSLADDINFLINKMYSDYYHGSGYKELQIDCDWTEKTKDSYFYLLKKLKTTTKKTISCTLRLYPYKYRTKMGIPPVDKATLMCYNLINPLLFEDKNSILSSTELESYLRKVKRYPIPLDIALPIFSWMQVYQNNRFVGVLNPPSHEFDSILHPIKPMWYEITKDREYENVYLRMGDKIKYEEVTEKTINETITLLKKYVAFSDTTTITLFHLDNNNIKKYSNETFHRFYTGFSK